MRSFGSGANKHKAKPLPPPLQILKPPHPTLWTSQSLPSPNPIFTSTNPTMASLLQSPTIFKHPSTPTSKKPISSHFSPSVFSSVSGRSSKSCAFGGLKIIPSFTPQPPSMTRLRAVVSEETSSATSSSSNDVAARRLYIGNIPRTVNNDELRRIVEEHGAAEKVEVMYDKYTGRSRRFAFATMKTVEDANAVIEKLDGTEIGGRKIKVNVTEKPLEALDLSVLQMDESQFVDSAYKVYVGNLAKTVTTDMLKSFFSEKGKVVGAKVQRDPGTSKSSGYGFVSFSSEEEMEAAISTFNNAVLEGQKIRVNKA